MYEKNDKLLYATDGICTVDDIAERTYNGITELYYILTPMSKRGSKIMIPTSNELLVSRMRKLLTRDEVLRLIDHIELCFADHIFCNRRIIFNQRK